MGVAITRGWGVGNFGVNASGTLGLWMARLSFEGEPRSLDCRLFCFEAYHVGMLNSTGEGGPASDIKG
jgi:hypothetical protein